MKIRPVGAELFRADGHADMRKLIVISIGKCYIVYLRGLEL